MGWIPEPGADIDAVLTTKGDVAVHDGTDTGRLAVGSNDQVLTADSAQAEGVKWATPVTGESLDRLSLPMGGFQAVTGSPAETSAGGRWGGWFFDDALSEGIASVFRVPDAWTSITVWIAWAQVTGNSGDVVWRVALDVAAEGESIAATGTLLDTTDTAPTTNLLTLVQMGSSAVTVAPGADILNFRLFRRGGEAGDTLTGDAGVVAAWVEPA